MEKNSVKKAQILLVNCLLSIWKFLKEDFRKWHAKTYQPEQEMRFDLEKITGKSDDDLCGLGRYIWFDCCINIFYFLYFVIVLVLIYAVLDVVLRDLNKTETLNMFIFLGCIFFTVSYAFLGIRDVTRMSLKILVPEFWNCSVIMECRKNYKYFYITECGILVFTNKKPFFLFCTAGRRKVATDWSKIKRNTLVAFMEWLFISTIYLRILWPYFFNPIQGAFLEYDFSAKKSKFQKGDRVLILGSGSVPHHVRWKNKLGSEGEIVALDIDKFVIKKSYCIERAIEWLRGIFGKGRWVSKHICADADKLPFTSGYFDKVVAIRCYYVNCEEALRVLKKGGKLIISNCGDVRYMNREKLQVDETFSGWIITTS